MFCDAEIQANELETIRFGMKTQRIGSLVSNAIKWQLWDLRVEDCEVELLQTSRKFIEIEM